MKKYLLLFLLFVIPVNAQIIAEQSQDATITFGALLYADENITNSTATTSSFGLSLISGASKTFISPANVAVENAMAGFYRVGIPSNLLPSLGEYVFSATYADCLPIWERISVISSNAFDEYQNGISDDINSVSVNVAAISVDVAAVSVEIGSLSGLIVAGNDIIPASGMTLPKFTYSREGDASRYIIARGLSYSASQPDVLFRFVDGSGNEVTHAMEDAFTWATFAMQAPDITGATPQAHLFKWELSDSVPDGWYQMYTIVESNSRAIGTVNTIILSPSSVIDDSSLVTATTFNAFISDVSESFRAIRKGHPAEFTAYRTSDELTRATPGVSSLASRHAAVGALYGLRSRFYDPFNEEYVTTDWLYDYDEIYGADGRGSVYEATVNSVTATAVIEDVTLTTTGEIE